MFSKSHTHDIFSSLTPVHLFLTVSAATIEERVGVSLLDDVLEVVLGELGERRVAGRVILIPSRCCSTDLTPFLPFLPALLVLELLEGPGQLVGEEALQVALVEVAEVVLLLQVEEFLL